MKFFNLIVNLLNSNICIGKYLEKHVIFKHTQKNCLNKVKKKLIKLLSAVTLLPK